MLNPGQKQRLLMLFWNIYIYISIYVNVTCWRKEFFFDQNWTRFVREVDARTSITAPGNNQTYFFCDFTIYGKKVVLLQMVELEIVS